MGDLSDVVISLHVKRVWNEKGFSFTNFYENILEALKV